MYLLRTLLLNYCVNSEINITFFIYFFQYPSEIRLCRYSFTCLRYLVILKQAHYFCHITAIIRQSLAYSSMSPIHFFGGLYWLPMRWHILWKFPRIVFPAFLWCHVILSFCSSYNSRGKAHCIFPETERNPVIKKFIYIYLLLILFKFFLKIILVFISILLLIYSSKKLFLYSRFH